MLPFSNPYALFISIFAKVYKNFEMADTQTHLIFFRIPSLYRSIINIICIVMDATLNKSQVSQLTPILTSYIILLHYTLDTF